MGRDQDNHTVVLPQGDREISVRVESGNLVGVFSPHPTAPSPDTRVELRRALNEPIGAPTLADAARGSEKVVIITDDMTRLTPLDLIVPELLEDLNTAGIRDEQITILIALGTHRPMTEDEIKSQFGAEVAQRVPILNHPWQDEAQLADLGVTPNGTPIHVCRLAVEADFLIGVGSIVPHHIPGFPAGAKIIQSGVTGFETTGATHLLSTRPERSYLGQLENPVRAEMETIADRVGLSAVLNCVLDPAGHLIQAFYGGPREAFRAGVGLSRDVYGVQIPCRTDIVLASSHPCNIEFWQAHKTLYSAELVVNEGGAIIVAAPCPEGVSTTHQDLLNFTNLPPEGIRALIDDGTITDKVSGALAYALANVRQHADVYFVSDGVRDEEARALGFTPFPSVQDALAAAVQRHGSSATISALTHAPDTLPLLVS